MAFFSNSRAMYSSGADIYGNVALTWPLTVTAGALPYLCSQIFLQ